MQRIVLTGGPGTGKSSVLQCLQRLGYRVGDDAARSIIRERKTAGLEARPEPHLFMEQILEREIAAYRSVTASTVFFERGVVDVAGSLFGFGESVRAAQLVEEFPYDHVFLFPPWSDIYRMDEERDHTFEHSVNVYTSTRSWYLRVGYDVIEVPLESPESRSQFILEAIKND